MKKSQVTFFFILGIMLVLSMLFLVFLILQKEQIYTSEAKKTFTFSDVKIDADRYIKECIDEAATTSIQDTGIREETLDKYKSIIKTKIESCVQPILGSLKAQKYDVDEGDLSVNVIQYPDTIQVDITYPIVIQKDEHKINLKEFHYTFDRAKTVHIPKGIPDKEINLVSANGKATLRIPEGVKITDKNGKPVENLGMKIEDLHVDGLENKYVLGQLLYNNFPEGVQFSEPVELSIEFRKQDIPENYSEKNIKIAYWNKESGLWYAYNTEVVGNKAKTNITHFSLYAPVLGKPLVVVNHLFNQRYSPTGADQKLGTTNKVAQKLAVWVIGTKSDSVTLQPNAGITANSFVNPFGANGKPTDFNSFEAIENEGYVDGVNLNDINYVDYQDFYNDIKDDFISPPKIEYGFFLQPDASSDNEFINCQPESPQKIDSSQIIYQTGYKGDDNPYFCLPSSGSYYNYKCTECTEVGYDSDWKNACNNLVNGFVIDYRGSELKCLPINEQRNSGSKTVPCCAKQYTPPVYEITEMPEDSPSCTESEGYSLPIFGLFNRNCAGGRLRGEGTEYADFIALAPNGNGILSFSNVLNYQVSSLLGTSGDTPLLTVHAKPPSDWLDLYLFTNLDYAAGDYLGDGRTRDETLYNYYLGKINKKGYALNYYCDIEPFPDSNTGLDLPGYSYKPIALSDSAKEIAINRMKSELGIEEIRSNSIIPAYGIYGLNIYMKENAAKDDIHTQCWTYWQFWGNGYVTNAPEYLSQEYDLFDWSTFEGKELEFIKILALNLPHVPITLENLNNLYIMASNAISGNEDAKKGIKVILGLGDIGDINSGE